MCDRFSDQGILDNVLLSPQLTLASKRAMLLVSRFFHQITDAHLRHPELHVSAFDCTIANARFVIRVLLPRVPGLLVCARGERFTPKMDFRKLRVLPNVRVHTSTCCMGPTAAYFLGHALAVSNGNVRLTMGRKKSLAALRERSRVYLDAHERLEEVDCNLVAGALLANAEARIERFHGFDLNLSSLYLNPTTLKHLRRPLYRAFDPPRYGPYKTINLSGNPLGPLGGEILAEALCSRRRSTVVRVQSLDMSDTQLGDEGVAKLAAPMPGGGLKIEELFLANVNMGNSGLKALMHGLRARGGHWHARWKGKDFVEDTSLDVQVLDLSENVFNDEGFEELMCAIGLSRLRVLSIRKLRRVSKRSLVKLGNAVREGLYPAIEDICADNGTEAASKQVPIQKAVKYWEAQRLVKKHDDEWKAFETQFEKQQRFGVGVPFRKRSLSDLRGEVDWTPGATN